MFDYSSLPSHLRPIRGSKDLNSEQMVEVARKFILDKLQRKMLLGYVNECQVITEIYDGQQIVYFDWIKKNVFMTPLDSSEPIVVAISVYL